MFGKNKLMEKIASMSYQWQIINPTCHFDEERGEIFAVQWPFKQQPGRFLASLEMT